MQHETFRVLREGDSQQDRETISLILEILTLNNRRHEEALA